MNLHIIAQIKWRRIILDEAHNIKDRRSSTAKAVFALDACYRWALSGTPLQVRCKLPMHSVQGNHTFERDCQGCLRPATAGPVWHSPARVTGPTVMTWVGCTR